MLSVSYKWLMSDGNPIDVFKHKAARNGRDPRGCDRLRSLGLAIGEPAGSSTCNAIPGPVTKPQAGMRAIHLQRCVFSRYPEFAGHGCR